MLRRESAAIVCSNAGMRTSIHPLLLAVLVAGCGGSSGGPGHTALGAIDFVPIDTAVDLTPDGSVALLTALGSAEGDVYLCDTETLVPDLVTTAGSPLRDFVTGISATLRVSALHGDPVQAGLWSEAGDWLDLGSTTPVGCDQDIAGAWDLSADGSVAVGMVWNGCAAEAFRWSDSTGVGVFTPMEVLGASFPGSKLPPSNRATVISDDGAVAAGWAQTDIVDRWPALWFKTGEGTLLDAGGMFPADAPGEILSISADGAVVAGIWNQDGFYWSEASGLVDIGRLPTSLPGEPCHPNAISLGGQLIFGGSGDPFFGIPAAFVWTEADGMRSLQEIAAASGIHIPDGTLLTNVLAASVDGSIVLGTAVDESLQQQSFVLKLPVSAYGL